MLLQALYEHMCIGKCCVDWLLMVRFARLGSVIC